MTRPFSRRFGPALPLAAAVLALAACGEQYPNSVFNHTSDVNDAILALWNQILLLGTIVFVFVEGLLIVTMIKFRKREGGPPAQPIHGNTKLEIAWTLIPAVILVMIAIPTVKTIYQTQSPAQSNALQVEVIGHQWWWEFRYPQYGFVTANEVYLPLGRTVSFTLHSKDVIHSFWTPQLSGKRDLIANKTNYLWYTPHTSLGEQAFNGFCTEYCGMSHANMRFRTYTVTPEHFEAWAAHQKGPAAGSPMAATARAAAESAARKAPVVARAGIVPSAAAAPPAAPQGWWFPKEKLQSHNIPQTPYPKDPTLTFDDAALARGDVARGRNLVTNIANLGKAPCLTCHIIRGEGEMLKLTDDAAKGPNLSHFATRHTLGGGLFPTDAKHVALWLKNAPVMKPGSLMPTLGTGLYNPILKQRLAAGLSDPEIADIVAYLMSLK